MGSGTSEKALPFLPILAPSPPPSPMEDWREDWKVTFSYLKEDPTSWSSFYHWESGSSAPSRLLCVSEPIMAPCILLIYSHKLGSFSHFCGGWALSLLQVPDRFMKRSVKSTYFFTLVQCLSLDMSFFSFGNSVSVYNFLFLSVSPEDGWMPLNADGYC